MLGRNDYCTYMTGRAKAIGARVKTARLAAGLTQEELARAGGIVAHTISRIERGKHTPTLEVTSAVASSCGVTIDWIATGVGDGPSEPAPRRPA